MLTQTRWCNEFVKLIQSLLSFFTLLQLCLERSAIVVSPTLTLQLFGKSTPLEIISHVDCCSLERGHQLLSLQRLDMTGEISLVVEPFDLVMDTADLVLVTALTCRLESHRYH